jgi:hypothetical protein
MRSAVAFAALLAVVAPTSLIALETGSLDKTPGQSVPAKAAPEAASIAQPAVPLHPAATAVRQRLADRKLDVQADERSAIMSLYDAHDGAPLFADANGLTPGSAVR